MYRKEAAPQQRNMQFNNGRIRQQQLMMMREQQQQQQQYHHHHHQVIDEKQQQQKPRQISNYTERIQEELKKNPQTITKTAKVVNAVKARENVKFDDSKKYNDERLRKDQQYNKIFNKNHHCEAHAAANNAAKFQLYDDDDDTDDVDSLYSNEFYNDYEQESETESLFITDEYTRRTLGDMETKMEKLTNQFVYRVKSEIDETFSKLKMQNKLKEKRPKCTKKNENVCEKGAGDAKKIQLDEEKIIDNMMRKKIQCYNIIDQNIKILKQVDDLTEKLYKNHLSNLKKY